MPLDEELFHVMRRLVQEHTAKWQEESLRLTKPQYAVMKAIHDSPGVDQARLTSASATSKATLAELLRRLEDRELIRRELDPGDARRRLVHLTQRGTAMLDADAAKARAVDESFLSLLDGAERQELMALLHKMSPPEGAHSA